MRPAHWSLILAAVLLVIGSTVARADEDFELDPPAPNSTDEPIAPAFSLERTAGFLDSVALNWTRERKCGTCHTNYAYMIGRPAIGGEASPAMKEIRAFFERRAEHWDDDEAAAKPGWDAEVIATAVTLALNDAATTGRLHPSTRSALDRIWSLQGDEGGFDWLKCGWPPYEHDDYYGAVFTAIGVGHAPEGYAGSASARPGIAKLRGYLNANPAPDLHHRTFLLWASLGLDGLMTAEQRDRTISDLLALQRADGGWNLPSLGDWKRRDESANDKDAPSDGYATGLVVYVLRRAGQPADSDPIRRGLAWLKSNQRESGRWFTRSLNNDKAHYITNAGTAFAAMAIRACEPSAGTRP